MSLLVFTYASKGKGDLRIFIQNKLVFLAYFVKMMASPKCFFFFFFLFFLVNINADVLILFPVKHLIIVQHFYHLVPKWNHNRDMSSSLGKVTKVGPQKMEKDVTYTYLEI